MSACVDGMPGQTFWCALKVFLRPATLFEFSLKVWREFGKRVVFRLCEGRCVRGVFSCPSIHVLGG